MHAYSCKHFTRSLTAAAAAAALHNSKPILVVVWDGGSSPGDVMYHYSSGMLKGRKWPGMSSRKKEEEESGCQDSAYCGYSRSM